MPDDKPDKPDLSNILTDLAKELDGNELEDIFEAKGHKWKIRLLNDEETSWTYRYVNPSNVITVATSMKLPILSMAVREMDGHKIIDLVEHEWAKLTEEEMVVYNKMNNFNRKYFAAEHFMEFLSQRLPGVVIELWTKYEAIEARRKAAQETSKKSSGEDSEKTEKENSTESSPTGEQ